ncbi:Tat pathway signal protein [Phenylobacterium sp. LH3H17]|uniref:Tat pathway signal protein n=1 Tax=Phenylobacterium sp. LH3H17 TaxID=2903901 RepID=UPI0020C9693E|nr:Tat pathway signal protein [Phenylobacterium sp. LH3H17]UTP39542.1 Tat pathway signal protein [Phenylobacterium sp. LH3H17]
MDSRPLLALALIAALAPGAALASGPEKKKGGGLTFIQLNTLTSTVIRPDGRRGVLTVETGIDVPDEKLRAKAEMLVPRLRAAYVQSLQIYASGMNPNSAPNADQLAIQLQRETDRVMGQKGAKLLLGTMLMN